MDQLLVRDSTLSTLDGNEQNYPKNDQPTNNAINPALEVRKSVSYSIPQVSMPNSPMNDDYSKFELIYLKQFFVLFSWVYNLIKHFVIKL